MVLFKPFEAFSVKMNELLINDILLHFCLGLDAIKCRWSVHLTLTKCQSYTMGKKPNNSYNNNKKKKTRKKNTPFLYNPAILRSANKKGRSWFSKMVCLWVSLPLFWSYMYHFYLLMIHRVYFFFFAYWRISTFNT